jgi:hypothetical protein
MLGSQSVCNFAGAVGRIIINYKQIEVVNRQRE